MPWYENRRGEKLWYEDKGMGRPVVLVHGWCLSSAVWKYQFDGLAASDRILAPDLRGHGRSRGISGSLSFDVFVEDLVDLFGSLNLADAVLVGWSMGGQIALKSYAELSDRLAGLVLVSATPSFTASADFPHGLSLNEVAGMRLKVQRNSQRAMNGFSARLFATGELENNSSAAEIKQLLSSMAAPDIAAMLDALDALAGADMRHLLGTISVPTLILNGAMDEICLPQASCYLKAHIPNATQAIFPECGHAPFLTQSYQFNGRIIRFVRSVCEQDA
ncbi:MAG: alpha/beta fold hydrolase [Desulfuromonadaceae bacterium]|nr:alpha/beta fold hydrolase [Desulfuromonadaceae bacterium]